MRLMGMQILTSKNSTIYFVLFPFPFDFTINVNYQRLQWHPQPNPNMFVACLATVSLHASFTSLSVRMLSLIFLHVVSPLFLPLLSPLPFTCSLTYFVFIYLLFHLAFSLPCFPLRQYTSSSLPFFPILPLFPADLFIGFVLALPPLPLPTGNLVVESSIKHHSKLLATPFLHLYGTIPE